MADPVATEGQHGASTQAEGGAAEHHGASVLGIEAAGFVSLAMLLVIVLLLWKKVPTAIGRSLDVKIAAIREQLAEAETLRKEAEALKAEYQAKASAADSEAAAMIERAQREAETIVGQAQLDAEELVARRTRMAEDKIAAEERAAVTALRTSAANAAARAAAQLIAERQDPAADEQLVNRAISEIGAR